LDLDRVSNVISPKVSFSGYRDEPFYPPKGSKAVGATPGRREFATAWLDQTNRFWLFGGTSSDTCVKNDLWVYDNGWIWMSGTLNPNDPGNYTAGINVVSPYLVPRARPLPKSYKDSYGNIYIFGGNIKYQPILKYNISRNY
jgi:hypothetical protein